MIYLRADGDATIGLGHLFRLLSIGEMLGHRYQFTLLTRHLQPNLRPTVSKVCHQIIEIGTFESFEQESEFLANTPFLQQQVLILDGYAFRTDYQRTLRKTGCRLLYIDDLHAFPIAAHALLNHSGGISAEDYETTANTRFYLGLDYALLRPPFLEAAQRQRRRPLLHRAFVCFGGADPTDHTQKTVLRLLQLPAMDRIDVVVGFSYRRLEGLQMLARQHDSLRLWQNLSAEALVELMSESSFAVCSASTICYEYAAVKGGLFLVQTADNQSGIYEFFCKNGLALPFEKFDISLDFQGFMDRQSQFIDGKTPERMLKIIETMA